MCGIVAIISQKRLLEEREQGVKKMMKIISHRGPDSEGVYSAGIATLGHKRLSIIDIENGSQPMVSEDGRYCITYNGEIYNYIELRKKLSLRGVKLKTFSDTEVLLQLLIYEGVEGINQLNGMFAFLFHDSLTGNFILCRDHIGIKPLYYYCDKDELIVASEIKAFIKSDFVKAKLNSRALNEYLTFQFCLNEKTLFDSIVKLEPGHYAIGNGCKIERIVRYWDTKFEVDTDHTEDYFEEKLLNLLYDSIKLQMRSDVPIGVYLSGGLDSSLIALLLKEVSSNNVDVFHGNFKDSLSYDESRYAKIVADKIGSTLQEITPTVDDFLNEFPQLIYFLDEPIAGPGSFPQLLVSRLAAKKVKVALGGQGGDELFCGYARYLVGYLEQAIKGSIFETQEEGKHLLNLSSIIKSLPILKEYTPMMRSFWKNGLFDEMDARYFRLVDRSPDIEFLLLGDVKNSFNKRDLFGDFQMIFNHPQTPSYINKMTHFDLKTLLPALLHVEDRVSMASSLESRVPLLDHRIIDLVVSMPPTIKFNEGQTKYILKKAVKNVMPAAILQRKDKMGFPVPIKEWVVNPKFKSFVNDILLSKKCRERGIYEAKGIDLLLAQDGTYGRQLWGALSLEMWFLNYFE